MSTTPLRRATASDADTLAVVGSASFLDAFIETLPGPHLVAHCLRQHSPAVYAHYLASEDPRTAAWLAEHAVTGAPVGYGLTCPPDLPVPTAPGDVELKRIYLLSRYQGTGAGRALMQAAIDHARACGAPNLLLGVYQGNDRAVAFYHRAGFETVGTRRFQVGDGVYDDLVMSLTL